MSDLISREAICNECMIEKGGKGCWACLVNDAPSVDAVEVVRCRECKYYKTELCESQDNHEDWFCADGERKEATE